MNASRNQGNTIDPFDPRNLWLAGLGLAAIARREARSVAGNAGTRAQALCGQLASLAIDTRDVVRGGAMTVREIVEPRLVSAGADAWGRVNPILDRFGIASPATTAPSPKPARRAAAKPRASAKPASRRAPRKPAARKTMPRRTS